MQLISEAMTAGTLEAIAEGAARGGHKSAALAALERQQGESQRRHAQRLARAVVAEGAEFTGNRAERRAQAALARKAVRP